MNQTTPLGPGAEFDAIRSLVDQWGALAVGIGDDAAMLSVPRGEQLVASVDSALENRHFRREWLSAREIGYRAVTAALSDIAAMGARPLGVLFALGLPSAWRDALSDLAAGAADAVNAAGSVIRGGNITDSDALAITTTVLGSAFAPLVRNAVRPGDYIYVTGSLGGARAGLRSLEEGRDPGGFRERFAHPRARIAEGQWLARGGAIAAIDVSDGLISDLRHLASASGVGIGIEARVVPCVREVALEDALISGEEYELIVAARQPLDVETFQRRFALPLTAIGRATDSTAGSVSVDGVRVANLGGYDHLSR